MRVRREAEGEGSGRCEREDAGAAGWSEREGKVRVRGEQYRAQRAGNGSGEQAAAGARRTARAVWPATREESTNVYWLTSTDRLINRSKFKKKITKKYDFSRKTLNFGFESRIGGWGKRSRIARKHFLEVRTPVFENLQKCNYWTSNRMTELIGLTRLTGLIKMIGLTGPSGMARPTKLISIRPTGEIRLIGLTKLIETTGLIGRSADLTDSADQNHWTDQIDGLAGWLVQLDWLNRKD